MELTVILETLHQHKAKDIFTADVSARTPLTDTIVICTATSNRHAKSLAESLIKAAKLKETLPSVEGLRLGEWILVNLEPVITHIMLADKREFYALEQLWIEKEAGHSTAS